MSAEKAKVCETSLDIDAVSAAVGKQFTALRACVNECMELDAQITNQQKKAVVVVSSAVADGTQPNSEQCDLEFAEYNACVAQSRSHIDKVKAAFVSWNNICTASGDDCLSPPKVLDIVGACAETFEVIRYHYLKAFQYAKRADESLMLVAEYPERIGEYLCACRNLQMNKRPTAVAEL